MRHQTRFRILAGTALPIVLAWAGMSCAQETPAPKLPEQSFPTQNGTLNIVGLPCVQPLPMVKLQDYNGPLQKTVGLFAQQLERKSVHPMHYKAGLKLCSLELKDKLYLFVRDTFDPVIFLSIAFQDGGSFVLRSVIHDDPFAWLD